MKRRKSPEKQKKDKLLILERKAWRVFSKWIRKRDNNVCFTCGSKATVAGHFCHNNPATKFDVRGVNAQCARCNRWLHGNLGLYAVNLDRKYGAGTAQDLVQRSLVPYKFSEEELRKVIDAYTKYNQLTN